MRYKVLISVKMKYIFFTLILCANASFILITNKSKSVKNLYRNERKKVREFYHLKNHVLRKFSLYLYLLVKNFHFFSFFVWLPFFTFLSSVVYSLCVITYKYCCCLIFSTCFLSSNGWLRWLFF